MKRWNIVGFVMFVVVLTLTLWQFSKDGGGNIYFMQPLLFVFGGIILIGIDRWAGDSKYGVFPITLLWTAYWGVVTFGLLLVTGLYGFALGFGHSGGDKRWIAELFMYGYFGATVLFGGLALSNIIKFFIALFSLPKIQS